MSIIEHAEKYLGEIVKGWKDESSDDNVQVVCFQDTPEQSINTYLTLGLNHHVLDIRENKKVRQELLFSIYKTEQNTTIIELLLYVVDAVLAKHKALLRGDVVELPVELVRKLGFYSIYCAIPVFWQDEFAVYKETTPPTVIVYIVPLHEKEAEFVKNKGWSAFEDMLEENNPDLFSLKRISII